MKVLLGIRSTDATELKDFIGLLVFIAALKDKNLKTEVLFDTSLCGNRYNSTMREKDLIF